MAIDCMVHPCGTSMTIIVTSYILLGTLGYAHLNLNLKCRFAKYLYKAINSQNERIAFLAELCKYKTMSITGSNISNILCEFNINMSNIINGSAHNLIRDSLHRF